MTSASKLSIPQQVDFLLRGIEGVYAVEELTQRLTESAASGKPLRVKIGLDPTAPDIHLGHQVVLGKLRQFQDLGHKAVLIVGDYTTRIGDPSGQNTTRPMLSGEQIDAHAATYVAQAGKILDLSPDKIEIRRNSEWLETLTFAEILKLAAQMTVARMLERDTFALRYKDQVPIGVHEFLYPLMQAYDSVRVQADVELGGSDQTFNNLCGRDIQRAYGQRPQIVIIMPILVGLDGTMKMSKSKGNYVGVTDAPNDMFGKIMSIPDNLMLNYFTLLTELAEPEVRKLVDPAQTHPRKAKAELGRMIVARYHGQEAGAAAVAEFDRIFSERQVPTDMPEIAVSAEPIGIVDLIAKAGFAASNSEARRLLAQGAVTIDDVKVSDLNAKVTPKNGAVLKVGKRRFGKLSVK
jgi:tyrosyl-tRNA synthetase